MDVTECSPLFEMSTLRHSVIACPNNNQKCPVSVELTIAVSTLRQSVITVRTQSEMFCQRGTNYSCIA